MEPLATLAGFRRTTDADLLNEALEKRDAAEPGWDEEANVVACRQLLADGISEDLLRSAYGENTLASAKNANA
jgi:hypothetical protein